MWIYIGLSANKRNRAVVSCTMKQSVLFLKKYLVPGHKQVMRTREETREHDLNSCRQIPGNSLILIKSVSAILTLYSNIRNQVAW